jgi:hypothetical protein
MAQTQPKSLWIEHQKKLDTTAILKIVKPQEQTNTWFLMGVIGISTIEVTPNPSLDASRYIGRNVNKIIVLDITLPNVLSLRQKIDVMRTAVRIDHNGYYS